ncbi:MAG: hypothetical protein NXI27_08485 [Alphaproteobacteria bacterium]|nr:hypothetical protein [Alphaproteobacteria bacterium]
MPANTAAAKIDRNNKVAGAGTIRPLRPEDRQAVRDICCRTAYRNRGCEAVFEDRELHADYWTRYYTDFAPEASWVVEQDGSIIGYFLGSTDHKKFVRTMGRSIMPRYVGKALWRFATRQYKKPQSGRYLRWFFFNSWREAPEISYGDYPAHYHCNILRAGYGRGYYTTLTLLFLDHLEKHGIMALHGHITEQKNKGIWDRFGNSFQVEHADFFSEKPSSLFQFVTGEDDQMVNRAWGIQTYKYRKWILWLKERYKI